MPVEQSDKASLAPFFAHLCKGGKYRPDPNSKEGCAGVEAYYNVEFVEFEKGVLYSDGRVDLCKMVTGPRNIGDLMDSLKPNTFSKHFLLGNNIIGPIGIKAIAAFIDEFPDRFETWYLAGNCIDKESFSLLVASMVKSSCITNVWLKRNPLGPKAAADVFRLITESTSLRTLDLDQTELGDEGVAELFGLLSEHTPTEPLPLRHLYLNASGIGANGCKQIADYMRSPHCTIESLYMSLNALGDAVIDLAAGLRYNSTLRRLVMQSCGIKDNGIIAIAAAFSGNVTIAALDVGQGYATADLGMRFNWIADDSAGAIVNLLHSTRLEYMNISYAPMSQQAMNSILAAMTDSEFAQWFFAKSLTTGGRDAASIKAGQEQARLSRLVRKRLHENVWAMYGVRYNEFESGEKRFLINPRDVRLIDSVYRNRDANAARRGLKHLDKWWNDDDETLARVQDGTL